MTTPDTPNTDTTAVFDDTTTPAPTDVTPFAGSEDDNPETHMSNQEVTA
ncbi:hypothetical protein [Actinocrispum wychmicini]|uniref:Uncharacterized protein n=1 Tax=Actinocrispum wychmicini TaxID=1213861 RepID=A0A4R2K3L3_9PSEU|nr:hypothetical protein [Actinocrispum wychmicini]TCO64396.1 hypothetical protein EV192_101164 [Actinocrispum wychmicini]